MRLTIPKRGQRTFVLACIAIGVGAVVAAVGFLLRVETSALALVIGAVEAPAVGAYAYKSRGESADRASVDRVQVEKGTYSYRPDE
jgi:hypothetical protein